jgi:S-adenosylmethionine:tRNA ribosyltransferase-isomerase
MKKSELSFDYPSHLVATERKPNSRVMLVENGQPQEVTPAYILTQIEPNDILIINETKVIPARIYSESGLEILFIENIENHLWKVLCPAKKWPKGKKQILPGGIELELVERGLPQTVQVNQTLPEDYFTQHGEMPLPPYIQEARGERHSRKEDQLSYQTDWADEWGSLAAPTASLHFSNQDLEKIRGRGGSVEKICLHVGLGTFLPIKADNLNEHVMHSEQVRIDKKVWEKILDVKKQGGRVWALGSTVTRALESQAAGMLRDEGHQYVGETQLFIKPGFEYQVVDVLMTNFHQPESTLVAMVMAFADKDSVLKNYQWAMDRNFRLFSYGDLSVWMK